MHFGCMHFGGHAFRSRASWSYFWKWCLQPQFRSKLGFTFAFKGRPHRRVYFWLTRVKKYLPLFSIKVATQQAFMKHLFFRTSQQTFLTRIKIDARQNPVWPPLYNPNARRSNHLKSHSELTDLGSASENMCIRTYQNEIWILPSPVSLDNPLAGKQV